MGLIRSTCWRSWFVASIACSVPVAGCGARTSVDDVVFRDAGVDADAGSDAPPDTIDEGASDVTQELSVEVGNCDFTTCAGCCDEQGVCQTGWEATACGEHGQACQPCTGTNQQCQVAGAAGGVCVLAQPTCGPDNCSGCCDLSSDPPVCRDGLDFVACGHGGGSCTSCNGPGQQCQPAVAGGGHCAVPDCGASTCNGCCNSSGACEGGWSGSQCGIHGAPCTSCVVLGLTCTPATGTCDPPCTPDNCDGCCMQGHECVSGTTSAACGVGGEACQSCAQAGLSCVNGACNALVGCPVDYAGCPLYLGSDTPFAELKSCSPDELAKLATACAGVSTASGCSQAIASLSQSNPACGACIDQFTDQGALVRCLVPYITQPCNHALNCSLDCVRSACGQCTGAQAAHCQSDVFHGGETCSGYQQGLTCYQSAIAGQASFCAFDGDYGAWIGAVGNHYCGTGTP